MMDDWQDLALSTRHYHNRLGRGAASGSRKNRHGSQFNVKRTFGCYEIICVAARKYQQVHSIGHDTSTACLDILRFSRGDTGLLGRLVISGVLNADVILAGSRKILQDLVDDYSSINNGSCSQPLLFNGLSPTGTGESTSVEGEPKLDIRSSDTPRVSIAEQQSSDVEGCYAENDDQENAGDEDEDDHMEDETLQLKRHNAFEKNSFRKPKFWFQWTGQASMLGGKGLTMEEETACQTGRGYVVFSGNDCKTFKGTITIDVLHWKDIPLTGRRLAHMAERDDPLRWFKDNAIQ